MAIEPSILGSDSLRKHTQAGRCALVWAVLSVMLLPGITRASIPVALYPVQGPATEKSRADVRDLIAAGLQLADHRQVFAARKPLVVPERCASPATTGCLAGLAGNGAVIYAVARDKASTVEVTLVLVTGEGKRGNPIQFENSRFFQDDRLARRAIEALESSYLQLGTAASTAAPLAPVPQAKAELAPSAPASSPTVASELTDEAPNSKWMTRAAIGCGVGGALALGGGVLFGVLAKNLNQDLTDRYQSQTLVPADRAKYGRLKTYDHLATAMLIGGGAVAAAGLTFWALSPSVGVSSEGGSLSLQGSF